MNLNNYYESRITNPSSSKNMKHYSLTNLCIYWVLMTKGLLNNNIQYVGLATQESLPFPNYEDKEQNTFPSTHLPLNKPT